MMIRTPQDAPRVVPVEGITYYVNRDGTVTGAHSEQHSDADAHELASDQELRDARALIERLLIKISDLRASDLLTRTLVPTSPIMVAMHVDDVTGATALRYLLRKSLNERAWIDRVRAGRSA